MATTRADIRKWLLRGIREGAAYVIIVCDTFDYDDYPVYVKPGEDFWAMYDAHNGKNMQRIMEVYDLSMKIDPQLDEHHSNHCPPKSK